MTDADDFFSEPLATRTGRPLRVALYDRLSHGIRSGLFPVGSPLLRESDLALKLGVSRTVVREALMLLEEDGLIVTRRGVGRFVVQSSPRVGVERARPPEVALAQGDKALDVELAEFSLQAASDFVASHLLISEGRNHWFRESVLLTSGTPVAILQEHLPSGSELAKINPQFGSIIQDMPSGGQTIMGALFEESPAPFTRASLSISPNVAGKTRGDLLQIPPTTPVLVVTQVAELDGVPVYLSKCILSPEAGALTVEQAFNSKT